MCQAYYKNNARWYFIASEPSISKKPSGPDCCHVLNTGKVMHMTKMRCADNKLMLAFPVQAQLSDTMFYNW